MSGTKPPRSIPRKRRSMRSCTARKTSSATLKTHPWICRSLTTCSTTGRITSFSRNPCRPQRPSGPPGSVSSTTDRTTGICLSGTRLLPSTSIYGSLTTPMSMCSTRAFSAAAGITGHLISVIRPMSCTGPCQLYPEKTGFSGRRGGHTIPRSAAPISWNMFISSLISRRTTGRYP